MRKRDKDGYELLELLNVMLERTRKKDSATQKKVHTLFLQAMDDVKHGRLTSEEIRARGHEIGMLLH